MKEKLKTALIIILLIISLVLIIACRTNQYYFGLPGNNPQKETITEMERSRFADELRQSDSMFYEKYEFPLTR